MNRLWNKPASPFLRTSHCEFQTTNRAAKANKPSFLHGIARYSRNHTFVSIELVTQSLLKSVESIFFYSLSRSFIPVKKFYGLFFIFIFFAHFAWACVSIFWLFILFISIVCLITHLFPHGFLWNLYQSFTYVYSTSIPNLGFTLTSIKGLEYILHCMSKDAITCTPNKWIGWNSILINYIDMLVFDSNLKKMWRLEFPREAY